MIVGVDSDASSLRGSPLVILGMPLEYEIMLAMQGKMYSMGKMSCTLYIQTLNHISIGWIVSYDIMHFPHFKLTAFHLTHVKMQ